MDFERIRQAAEGYRADMTRFLRDMIAIPSESCEEEGVAKRIAAELTKLGYDKVEFGYCMMPDGTGYMRVWDKYFDLVWNDNEIYYYDVSGRHLLSLSVGCFYFDRGGAAIVRLFKDELNPVPPRPKELGGKG